MIYVSQYILLLLENKIVKFSEKGCAMKSIKKSANQNKKIYMILCAVALVLAIGVYGIGRRATSPDATSGYSSATVTTTPTLKADEVVTAPTPAQSVEGAVQTDSPYRLHENITATVFWAGEGADSSNDYIHNRASAWMSDWVTAYGGIDDPEKRCGYRPCGFTPKENPFYFALPFNDYNENGLRPEADLQKIPWYTGSIPENTSIIKNRWIEVRYGDRVAYAQWEDVGPFGEDDASYVFGTARPAEPRAGLDLSPALANYLRLDGRGVVSWRFVESGDVPKGEWTKIVTNSGLRYE
jgi:hypothetical protein